MSIGRNRVVLCGAAALALLATGSETHAARAAAARLKSIVPMVLDDTVVDDHTGQDVILLGLFHVQATLYPPTARSRSTQTSRGSSWRIRLRIRPASSVNV